MAPGRLGDRAAVVIEVTDDGEGIAGGHMEMVFDRFREGTESSGPGLGLTITRGLVEAHGDTISASSEVGVGVGSTRR